MKNKRFELILPSDQRAALDDLAAELGCTVAELLRMGGSWVVHNREFLVRGRPPVSSTTGAAA
jgi:hypothetical protein